MLQLKQVMVTERNAAHCPASKFSSEKYPLLQQAMKIIVTNINL